MSARPRPLSVRKNGLRWRRLTAACLLAASGAIGILGVVPAEKPRDVVCGGTHTIVVARRDESEAIIRQVRPRPPGPNAGDQLGHATVIARLGGIASGESGLVRVWC